MLISILCCGEGLACADCVSLGGIPWLAYTVTSTQSLGERLAHTANETAFETLVMQGPMDAQENQAKQKSQLDWHESHDIAMQGPMDARKYQAEHETQLNWNQSHN